MTISEAQSVLHCPDAYGGIYGEKYGQALEIAFECMKTCEQTDTFDKIRAEIEQLASRYTISRERGSMGQVEWADRLIREADILQILDKYKAESEDTE